MKTLILPLLLIILPIALLFFILKYWTKKYELSMVLKIALGLIFIAIGLFTSYYAVSMSIEGMADKQIKCFTGVAAFIPFSFVTNIIGIPLLLSFYPNKTITAK